MLKMVGSASRVVLLTMTITVCAAFLVGRLDAQEFLILASMVFAFYFTKTNTIKNSSPED
jgi:hypothetical protein